MVRSAAGTSHGYGGAGDLSQSNRGRALDGDGMRVGSFLGPGREMPLEHMRKRREGGQGTSPAPKLDKATIEIRAPLPSGIPRLDAYAEGDYSSLASFPSLGKSGANSAKVNASYARSASKTYPYGDVPRET
jgi:hypothetical protein